MAELRKPMENQGDEAIASAARSAGLQSCCLTFTIFVFRELRRITLCFQIALVRELLYNGAVRFSAENGAFCDIFEIRDFRFGFTRGSLHPA
jgi:hypothetical protein